MSVIADYAHLYETEIRPRRRMFRNGAVRYPLPGTPLLACTARFRANSAHNPFGRVTR